MESIMVSQTQITSSTTKKSTSLSTSKYELS